MDNKNDSPEEYGTEGKDVVARWLDEIKLAEKGHRKWNDQCDKILERYKDDKPENVGLNERRFNIFWSNVETLKPALYNRTPDPKVLRKYKDKDPLARKASETLERAVKFDLSDGNFDDVMRMVRDDYLLFARGVAWARYKPLFESVSVGDDEESGTAERVISEEVEFDYVGRKDFVHPMVPIWDKVPWVARISYMTKGQAKKRFDEKIVAKLSVKHKREGASDTDLEKNKELFGRIKIYEVWDKVERKVHWICPDYGDSTLETVPDPLGLQDFFPCPRPLYGTLTNDSLIPIPDYHEYASQAKELDDLSVRIAHLTRAIKVNGAYNGALPELSRLLSEDNENEMIPVNDWPAFQQTGGLDGHMSFLPIDQMIKVLVSLQQQRERVKADLYEITGLSDILRGYSNPNATATAEQIKSNFASLRLEERQARMAEFARGLLRIKAEIIAEHFSPETIREIANYEEIPGQEPIEGVVALLRNNRMRAFRLSVETDATVEPDQQREKESRMEFLSAVTGFMDRAVAAGQEMPQVAPLLFELLKYGVRAFGAGREMEEAFDRLEEALLPKDGEPVEQAPNPEQIAKDMGMQLEQAKLELKGQELELEQFKEQGRQDSERMKQQNAARLAAAKEAANTLKQMEILIKKAGDDQDAKNEVMLALAEMQQQLEIASKEDETKRRGQDLDALVKISSDQLQARLKQEGMDIKAGTDMAAIMRDIFKDAETNIGVRFLN